MKFPRFEQNTLEKVSKEAFDTREPKLQVDLLRVQRESRARGLPIIILVSGVEASGKSEVVNRLSKWLDMRNVRTVSFWDESDEERFRPHFWRFWRHMPGRGNIVIMFGSWYTDAILHRALEDDVPQRRRDDVDAQCHQINRLEKLLTDDGYLLIKFWFHISAKEQARRIEKKARKGRLLSPYESQLVGKYDRVHASAHRVIEHTDTAYAPWMVIPASQPRSRDLRAGECLLAAMQNACSAATDILTAPSINPPQVRLANISQQQLVSEDKYSTKLKTWQRRVHDQHWRRWEKKQSTVLVFEGWDAAGKGGAIRRLTSAMDARLFRVIPIAAPSDEELNHHYLWRFWRLIPRDGYCTIYDRSWYGRVLVERVEQLTPRERWQNAYQEINAFEKQLTDHGVRLLKFWLHITPEEQLSRFHERENVDYKRHKITDEDWRNRDRWDDYWQAAEEMFANTDTENAPWHIVPANDKRSARIQVLKTVSRAMKQDLKR